MSTENDTSTGDGGLSMDEAAKAFVKATTPEAASDGQADEDDLDMGTATDDQLEPEGDGEEEGDPADDDGQADDDENEDEPDSDQGRFVAANGKVRLPDGSVASVNDLIQGNLRDRDYRQKTMEVAEQRRSVESQSSLIKQQEQYLAQQRDYVSQLIQSIMPQEPDPQLAQTDPYAYTTQKANFDAWQRHSYYLANEQTAAQQRWAEEARQAKRERENREWEALTTKAPALKDETRLSSFVKDLKTHGPEYGFTVEEMGEALAMDHRNALVMRDAIAWRKLQASKPKMQSKVEGRPPVQKSGKRLSSGDQRARSATVAMDRLKQSGSVDDAARAYLLASRKG
jgi:hypothetical protein